MSFAETIVNALTSRPEGWLAYLWTDEHLIVRQVTPNVAWALSEISEPREALGRPVAECSAEMVGLEAVFRQMLAGERERLLLEHVQRDTPDGVRYLSLTVFPATSQDGAPGLLFVFEDTTPAGHLLQQLNQSRNTLRLTQRQLERVLAEQQFLFYLLTHDAGNHLTHILGAVDVLREFEWPEEQAHWLGMLYREGHWLSMLFRSLMLWQRDRQHQLTPRRQPMDLKRLLEEMFELYLQPEHEHLQPVLDLPEQAASWEGDPLFMRQILHNLLFNALKYTPAGETVRLALSDLGEAWQIEVKNTGVELPAEVQQRLFEPFVPSRGERQGSGLGLYLAHRLAHSLGGDLRYVPEPGAVTFHLWLPKARPAV